jgi:electron transfer flavoprotein alpha subunit
MNSGAIAVVAEHHREELAEITLEMLSCGRELADALEAKLWCILLTKHVEPFEALPLAADELLIVQHELLGDFNPEAYTKVLVPLLAKLSPQLILLGNTSSGTDLAGPLSTSLRTKTVSSVTALKTENGKIVATSSIYGGKILALCEISQGRAIVLLTTGSYPKEKGMQDGLPSVEVIPPPVEIEPLRIRFREFIEPEVVGVDISKVPVLVAAGRGVQSRDNLAILEELAEALGGAVCATRPLVDQGWLSRSRQVGRSGMTVKPRLYLSLGVSGAPEHVEGMKESETIVAINTDPDAPIFNIAHYGVVADLFEVVPQLVKRIREVTGRG